ncbi:MAG: TIGR03545 family protein [Candidatus Cloacimonetes bacterium]|nr:TIGR03545 family protein [Candidatus Cloacimonadota bacterium]
MRVKGIIFLLVLAIIIVVISLIFTDSWLEKQMEMIGSKMVGAKVEFDGLDFSLFSLRLSWDRLRVTNPDNVWENSFESGFTEFNLAFAPLLKKKFVIENLQMSDVAFNTERTTDGSLPKKWQPKKKEEGEKKESPKFIKDIELGIKDEMKQMPVLNLDQFNKDFNVDSLMAMADMKTPQKVDSLILLYEQKYDEWEKRIEDLPDQEDVKELEAQVKSLDINNIKTVQDAEQALATIKTIIDKANGYKKQYDDIQLAINNDSRLVQNLGGEVTYWIDQDKNKVLSYAKLPDLSTENMGKIVFGTQVIDKVNKVIEYVGKGKAILDKLKKDGKPKKEKKPRSTGQNITYPPKPGTMFPSFWIKKIDFSSTTETGSAFSGVVSNITSDQKLIDAPTVLAAKAIRQDNAQLDIELTFDYRFEQSEEKLTILMSNLPMKNIQLSNTPLLPSRLESGSGKIDARMLLHRPEFETRIDFVADKVQFTPSPRNQDMDKRLVRISENLAASITTIDFKAKLWQEREQPLQFTLTSNLDKMLTNAAKDVFQQELDLAKQELRAKVDKELQKYKDQLNQEIQKQQRKLQAMFDEQKSRFNKEFVVLDDLIGEDEDILGNVLQNQAKDLLDGLFKF